MKQLQITAIVLSMVFIGFRMIDPPKHNPTDTDVIACTELNGEGCVCHSIYEDTTVLTWVEGPAVLQPGETALYKVHVAGGPALGGGFNVASRFGQLAAADSTVRYLDHELTQQFPMPYPPGAPSVYWDFYYTAPTNKLQDTIYSVGLSTNHDLDPGPEDLWSFGPKFVVDIRRGITGVEDGTIPAEFKLMGSYPNPFNPSTSIRFALPKASDVEVVIYDISGREVAAIKPGTLEAGIHNIRYDASSLPGGVYFYRISAGSSSLTGKMILSK